MAIGQRPLVSFAIANNVLTPNIRATDLGISPRAIVTITWNNSENLEDESFGMKHLKRCSYTIPKSPPKNKWGVMTKVWAYKVLSRTKNRWKDKV
jgi:hypothetical protein